MVHSVVVGYHHPQQVIPDALDPFSVSTYRVTKEWLKETPLYPCSLDALACNLSPVETSKRALGNSILVLATLNLVLRDTQDDFNVYGVTLVRVNATVGTVCPAACFLMNSYFVRIKKI
jgi:hypothetical protein